MAVKSSTTTSLSTFSEAHHSVPATETLLATAANVALVQAHASHRAHARQGRVSTQGKRIDGAAEPVSGLRGTDKVPTCSTVLDLTVHKRTSELNASIRTLVHSLFPTWAQPNEDLDIKRISGAMTNAVFFVTNDDQQRMILRVYGVGCDQLLDRDKELRWLRRLSRLGLGPSLLGQFGNGRFEEYLPSTTLTHDDLSDPTTSRQVASRLSELHHIVQIYPPPSATTTIEAWANIDHWYHAIQSVAIPEGTLPYDSQDAMARLGEDLVRCKAVLARHKSPIVFAHNDTQYGNLLRVHDTHELVVIDFEYAGYNTRGFDIANHFCEWMFDYNGVEPAKMHPDAFPSVEQQRRFLSAYLAKEKSHVSVDSLLAEVSMWIMVSHLFWGLWGVLQSSQSEIDFDYALYARQRLEAFRAHLARYLQ